MLEQDPGSPKLYHLQIIVLTKGDMHITLKVYINNQLILQAESTGLISSEQFENGTGIRCGIYPHH